MKKRFQIREFRFEIHPRRSWRFFAEGAAGGGAGGSAGGGAAPSALAGPDGVLADNWLQHEKIPAELRTDKTLATIKDVSSMASIIVNAQKTIGKLSSGKGFAFVPEGKDDKAGLDAYYEKVGWPGVKGPDAYPKIAPPADMPKELAEDPETAKQWRAWCHEARLTPEQMVHLSQKILESNVAAYHLNHQERAAKLETDKAALQTKWQAKYPYKVQRSGTVIAAFGNDAIHKHFEELGLLQDPFVLEFCDNVAEAVSPDRLHASSTGGIDAGSIRRQIDEIMASDVYSKEKGPLHDRAVERVMALRNQLHAAG